MKRRVRQHGAEDLDRQSQRLYLPETAPTRQAAQEIKIAEPGGPQLRDTARDPAFSPVEQPRQPRSYCKRFTSPGHVECSTQIVFMGYRIHHHL